MSLLGKGASVAEVQYNALMQRNAQYVVRDAQQEKLLFRQWFYTKLSKSCAPLGSHVPHGGRD